MKGLVFIAVSGEPRLLYMYLGQTYVSQYPSSTIVCNLDTLLGAATSILRVTSLWTFSVHVYTY